MSVNQTKHIDTLLVLAAEGLANRVSDAKDDPSDEKLMDAAEGRAALEVADKLKQVADVNAEQRDKLLAALDELVGVLVEGDYHHHWLENPGIHGDAIDSLDNARAA